MNDEISFNFINVQDMKANTEAQADILLIDARSPEEYSEAHVPMAINVPVDCLATYFQEHADKLNSAIVTMCGSSGRGKKAAAKLIELGAPDVRVLDGGLKAWREAGLPIY
jgi:rhodanese-related sulfurtransferase